MLLTDFFIALYNEDARVKRSESRPCLHDKAFELGTRQTFEIQEGEIKKMKQSQSKSGSPYEFYGKIPLRQAIPLGLQHVLAMFVGNLTPILIICGACGISATSGDAELAALQVTLLQNAMLVAGIVTLVQLFAIGPVGGKAPSSWVPVPVLSAFSRVWPMSWVVVSLPMVRSWEPL